MLPIRRILHPTDFSASAREAFDHAVFHARQHDAEVHVLTATTELSEDPIRGAFQLSVDEDDFYRRTDQEADVRLKEMVETVETPDVLMRRVHRRGAAAGEVITSYAEEEAVDLIVMGTHGRRGLRRLALGSVAEEVVREAPCAVMTVREETRPKPQAIDRMLVPVDFSDVTTTLAERATALAAAYDAAVDLVHVVEPMPSVTTMGEGWVGPELIPQLVDQAGKELERLAEAVGAEVPVATHVSQGPPASAILDTAADRESDLIAMASHGRTGLERVMLGSVTARVVRRAECPVVTLRAAKASAEEDEAS